ncbi:hypothetical protein [Clostridium chromiireducens]|uniref:Lipoprotein n=1 Tax=Clostridium chromiireducens TaxID=225345 RepID=A0A1V4IAI9_9CLOT|nr:hypothetical protein [Clostridium chromiireducens]MVX63196.1 hypothetical protein [Clostridium chromiireducens]OPJ56537.1 hypothetical protein CLCHR_45630 [Clostridium chromiireducens]RII33905.1 hypothetical protein D2A34_12000 [Clostridium chromiireducens]
MRRKSILLLFLAALVIFSLTLIGCGNRYRTGADNNGTTRNNAGGMEGTNGFTRDNAWDDDGTNANNSDATRDKLKATADSIKYSAVNFADDLRNSGYNLTESANTKKNYFKGNETDYLLGGDVVRLYEYGSPAELEGDINRIAPGGMSIHGTDANYTRSPYYYRKGNTLIMYEGNEPAYIDEFRNNYGNAITR